MSRPVCAIIGVGPGNGAALARRFAAAGYAIALLGRTREKLARVAENLEHAQSFRCDAADPESVRQAFAALREALGPVQVLCYNAGAGHWASPEATTVEALEASWRTNALGLLVASQQVIPDMTQAKGGVLLVTGATASLRGRASTTAFAAAKAAQRSLAQSLARHLGPRGIHVAYFVIDGVIDLPETRARMPDAPDDFFLEPDAIAETMFQVAAQPRSAWTFELDLRPFGETW